MDYGCHDQIMRDVRNQKFRQTLFVVTLVNEKISNSQRCSLYCESTEQGGKTN